MLRRLNRNASSPTRLGLRVGTTLCSTGAVMLALAGGAPPAAAQEPARFTIGYLEIGDDPRYAEQTGYTGIRLRTRKRPFAGAASAVRESRIVGRALKLKFVLDRVVGASAAELAANVARLHGENGVRFFVIDAPGDIVGAVAAATADRDLLLFNVSATDDTLRGARCRRNLMHVIPSRRMLSDGLVQYLVSKKWRDVLVLKGPLAEDAAITASFRRSMRKFGAKVVAVKDFILSNDPRERDRNNIALMTAGPRYDVVFLADSDGEFGRYVPYQISHARPIVGTEGLIAATWHWTWERHGAPQLNQRFEKRAKRRMRGADWAAWAAVKMIVEARARTRKDDFTALAAYLKSESWAFDAYKGAPASFRVWNNQLRQPILLHTHNAVIGRAPMPGFLHPKNNLDTLGLDEPESKCAM